MRAADRDRCRRAVAALGIVLVIACTPACALSAAYAVAGNGTAYLAHLEVHDADGYSFVETGILGERIPIPVSGVLVTNETGAVAFEEQGRTGITFPRGDYTITFAGTVRDSYL
ncbi:MAG: hypothetical protein GKC04_06700, partial [Methanomicrobiales archaeon]|nr:hypothetical protein [Methanomicrobiales archaeon]